MRIPGSWCLAVAALLCSSGAGARDKAGEFDYWTLALSWSPEYCIAYIGDEECRLHLDFVVHGLRPQNERSDGPSRCGDRERVPKELMVRMLPLMASEKGIQHEWNVDGSCSGLDQQTYFELVERARRKLELPKMFEAPDSRIETSRDEIVAAFRHDNPGFENSFALDCRGHWLREVQVCFDRDLNPRACGREVENDCGSKVLIRSNR